MDLYGLIFLELQIWNFWIISSQLLIGLIVLGCYIIYQTFFTIVSYSKFFFSCQKDFQLDSILEHFLVSQFCIALISLNLVRFYDYSSLDLCYQFLRICQYFCTYLFLQKHGKENALQLHYILDTLMNIYGILYLNYESIFFWFILGQIALGCIHYCTFIMSLIIFTFSNYYFSICDYIYFLNKVIERDDQAGYMKNFIRLYLLTQLALAIQFIFEQFLLSENIWSELIKTDIIYFIFRIIQYSFHLIIQEYYQDFGSHYYYHFTVYFLMDIFGLYSLFLISNSFWNILFQIILGFIIYQWILIRYVYLKVHKRQFSDNMIKCPLFNTFIIFFMLEIIFSIIGIKFNFEGVKCYLILRMIQYGMVLLIIKFSFIISDFWKVLITIILLLLSLITVLYLFIKMFRFLQQQIYVNLLLFTQLFVDLIIIGSLLFSQYLKNKNLFLEEYQNAQEDEQIYKMKQMLWWLQEDDIEKIKVDQSCIICYEKLLNDSETCKLECHPTHEFHIQCLQRWEVENSTCPICRQQIKRQIQALVIN
ncbi:unnamed protein product (macronuclear) [Paramecium tetraurelia]|uniref:RING-type domain-containing protein n=1 Tax=Paramecium tetraurelia TaxID=5888 RepID=A0EGS5_PARTE|nr:uncharacterized protein GSPATT00026840001 [Paramecium tetraurelia]CAK94516.1 unnamed protein product [Paramecium tetraurelia]|eukprot:XP_001461889.1 hypothetical protein (macronuclear) [Paramecium tetraurelia strain d4-2]